MRSKYWFDIFFGPYRSYLLGYYLYVRTCNLWPIFGLTGSNENVFESIANLWNRIAFTCSRLSLSYIRELVLENKSRVSCTPVWDILRDTRCRNTCCFFLRDIATCANVWRYMPQNLLLFDSLLKLDGPYRLLSHNYWIKEVPILPHIYCLVILHTVSCPVKTHFIYFHIMVLSPPLKFLSLLWFIYSLLCFKVNIHIFPLRQSNSPPPPTFCINDRYLSFLSPHNNWSNVSSVAFLVLQPGSRGRT